MEGVGCEGGVCIYSSLLSSIFTSTSDMFSDSEYLDVIPIK